MTNVETCPGATQANVQTVRTVAAVFKGTHDSSPLVTDLDF